MHRSNETERARAEGLDNVRDQQLSTMVMAAMAMLPLPTRNQSMQVMTRQMQNRIIQRRGELALKTIQAVMKPNRFDNNLAETIKHVKQELP